MAPLWRVPRTPRAVDRRPGARALQCGPMSSSSREPLIGRHGILLHVGPHKTGTSAIQGTIHSSVEELGRHGVTVPGTRKLQSAAARGVTDYTGTPGVAPGTQRDWKRLVAKTVPAPERAIISSEYFDIADERTAARIRDDLGAERLHVVITAAPLTSILPANWQQRVRIRETRSFESWLKQSFARHDAGERSIFWRRQHLDWQVETWEKVVGIDRIHVVIGDKHRPRLLFDSFEDLLGLPREIMQPRIEHANRSLRWVEAEFLRALNLATRDWDAATHARFIRLGASRAMLARHEFGPADEPIRLPRWAHERALEIAESMVDGLRASGVHVMGDLQTLLPPLPERDVPQPSPEAIDPQIAVRAVLGTARAGGAGLLREKYVSSRSLKELPGLRSATDEELTRELARREADTSGTLLPYMPSDRLVAELRRRAATRVGRLLGR